MMENRGLKSRAMIVSADLAVGRRLGDLYFVCHEQQTISTSRLMSIVEDLHERDKGTAVLIRRLAENLA